MPRAITRVLGLALFVGCGEPDTSPGRIESASASGSTPPPSSARVNLPGWEPRQAAIIRRALASPAARCARVVSDLPGGRVRLVRGIVLDTLPAGGWTPPPPSRFTLGGYAAMLSTRIIDSVARHQDFLIEGHWAYRPLPHNAASSQDTLVLAFNGGFSGETFLLGPARGDGARAGHVYSWSDAMPPDPPPPDPVSYVVLPCRTIATPDMGLGRASRAAIDPPA